jgi:RNA polymerase primary sigma factor
MKLAAEAEPFVASLQSFAVDPESKLICKENRALLRTALMKLTPREHRILDLINGLSLGVPMTRVEIAREMQLSNSRIQQIEWKAMRKMKHPERSRHLRQMLEDLGKESLWGEP